MLEQAGEIFPELIQFSISCNFPSWGKATSLRDSSAVRSGATAPMAINYRGGFATGA